MQWYIPDQTTRSLGLKSLSTSSSVLGERFVKYLYLATVGSLSVDDEDCTISLATSGRSFHDKYHQHNWPFLAAGLSASRNPYGRWRNIAISQIDSGRPILNECDGLVSRIHLTISQDAKRTIYNVLRGSQFLTPPN
jgi:hypothetical protein